MINKCLRADRRKNMNYLLVWDIDGTLIHSKGAGRRAMNRAFLDIYGIEDGFKNVEMAGKLDSVILQEVFRHHGIKGEDGKRFFERYCKHLEDEIRALNSSLVLPGVTALLEELDKRENIFNVLGTGNIENGARIKLQNDNLNRFFPTGGFGDEPMERWQVIAKAIENASLFFGLEFGKDFIYVIGDTPRDMECAKKLGIKAIGAATGPYKAAQLLASGAYAAFPDLSDIKKILDTITANLP